MGRKVSQNKQADEKGIDSEKKIENLTLTCNNTSNKTDVCLQTLRVRLRGPDSECIVRVLIDSGSHKSYVLESVAQKMHLNIVGQQSMIHLLFGGVKTEPRDHRKYKLRLCSLDGKYECRMTAFDEEVICRDLPAVSAGPWMQTLRNKGISLSDVP